MSRSSIFSFSTLSASLWPGRALWLALALVAAAETALRFWPPRLGYHEGISSLPQWVSLLEWELETRRPTVWLLGNSVLAYGVDAEALSASTGQSCLALPFGNATLAGDVAMASHFADHLSHAHAKGTSRLLPRNIVVCITKDDVNPNGLRAWLSKKYMSWDSLSARLQPGRMFKIFASRQTIMNTVKSALLGRDTAAPKSPSEPAFGGVVTDEKRSYMRQYMQDYDIDVGMFDNLAEFAARHNCRIHVVHVPVTTLFMEFHDAARPDFPFAAAVSRIAELCAERDFTFIDSSRMMPDDYSLYADPDHLTAEGRTIFTRRLTEALPLSPLLFGTDSHNGAGIEQSDNSLATD